jgi:P pilus assembly protein, pilin FimA
MKLNKIMIAAVMAMGVSSFTHAADQGHGVVEFTGSIIDAPCSVDPDSSKVEVKFGQVSKSVLADGGKSASQDFTIDLVNCDFGSPATNNKVTATFNGVSATTDNTLLNIAGTASGAGVGIQTYQGEQITLGTPSSAFALSGNGDHQLKFAAFLQGLNSGSVTEGDFSATANFELAYQ